MSGLLGWLKGLGLVGKLIAAVVAMAILFAGYMAVKRFFTVGIKTENKLNKGLGEAAMESGGDAVDTVSNRAADEAADLREAQETADEIRRQTNAGDVTRTGRNSLCHRSPNRRGCGVVSRPPAE